MGALNFSYLKNTIGDVLILPINDSLLSNGIVLKKGMQLIYPINFDRSVSVGQTLSYSTKLNLIDCKLNLGNSFHYLSTPGQINDKLITKNSYLFRPEISLSRNVNDFEFKISYRPSYNYFSNGPDDNSKIQYLIHKASAEFNFCFLENFFLRNNISYSYNTRISILTKRANTRWNASIGFKFLKENRAELKLGGYNILNESDNVLRNDTQFYYEDSRISVMPRIFFLTFSYNLRD